MNMAMHSSVPTSMLSDRIARVLAAGFGATTLMWLWSYLAILLQGAGLGDVLFGLAILSLLGGGLWRVASTSPWMSLKRAFFAVSFGDLPLVLWPR